MQPGDYVNIGSNLINVVPLPNVYVIANYKETQLTRVKPGQPVDITVDSFPGQKLHGRVERIAPATGSQFALLPPDNATGNFTKVVQRIPVRIQLDKNQPLLERLLPGMSVVTSIHTDQAAPMAENDDAESRAGLARRHRAAAAVRGRRGAARLVPGQFRQPPDLGRPAGSARRVFAVASTRAPGSPPPAIGSQIFIAPAVAWLATVFGLRRVLGIPSLIYAAGLADDPVRARLHRR